MISYLIIWLAGLCAVVWTVWTCLFEDRSLADWLDSAPPSPPKSHL